MTKTMYKDNEVLRLKYFYDLFLKRKRLYPTSYFLFPLNTRKKKIPLDKLLHKKIIQTYLDIYFNDFYNKKSPIYFLLSGKLVKVKGSKFILNKKKGIFREAKSIGWIWYLRPSLPYISNIRLIKLKGSTSRLNKLEKRYHVDNDVDLLKPYNKAYRDLLNSNKLFKNE